MNPATTERFFKDRFSELPEPIPDPFPMEVKLPEGFQSAEVWMLTAEPMTASAKLESRIEGSVVKFNVPSLVIYRVIVIESAK